MNREILADMLKEEGLKADAENGEMAVTMAGANRYDIILMDLQMPVMDGLAATKAIRLLPGYRQTPIIAVTANAFEKSREDCLHAGMNDFLCKPLDPDHLHEALAQWLRKGTPPTSVDAEAPPAETVLEGGDFASLRRCLGEIAGIDLDSGLRRVKQPQRYIRYLQQYANKYEGGVARIRELLASGDLMEASRLAHALKGASVTTGRCRD